MSTACPDRSASGISVKLLAVPICLHLIGQSTTVAAPRWATEMPHASLQRLSLPASTPPNSLYSCRHDVATTGNHHAPTVKWLKADCAIVDGGRSQIRMLGYDASWKLFLTLAGLSCWRTRSVTIWLSLPWARGAMSHQALYYEGLDSIPEPISELLDQYSGIKKDEQIEHVLDARNRAYAAHRYPCLGRFRFLELDLSTHPLYRSYVIPTLQKAGADGRAPPIFLDLGTCLGQDIRKLIFDGVSVSQVYGSDIQQEFIDAGYELFQDGKKLPRDRFLCPANVFDDLEASRFQVLKDRVDILHATSVFHLFAESQQSDVARCCMRLLRKDPICTSLVLGAQAGNINAGEYSKLEGKKRFRHNEKTWKAMWEQVCQEDEFRDKVKTLRINVEMEMYTPAVAGQPRNSGKQKQIGSFEEGFRWMKFEVWITF